MEQTPKSSRFSTFLKAVIGIALVAILLFRSNLKELLSLWEQMQPFFLLHAFGFAWIQTYIGAVKLQMILKQAGYEVPMWKLIKISFISLFVGQFIPTQLGVDGIRIFYLSRHLGHTVDSISSVALDRFINLVIITLMGTVSFFASGFYSRNPELIYVILPIFAGMLLLTVLFFTRNCKYFSWMTQHIRWSGKIAGFFEDLNDSLKKYDGNFRLILMLIGLSFLFQTARFTTAYYLACALNIHVPYGFFFICVPVVTILAMLPFAFAGLGITQFSTVYIFELAGIHTEAALGYAFLQYIFLIVMSLPGGLFFYLEGMGTLANAFKRKKKSSAPSERSP